MDNEKMFNGTDRLQLFGKEIISLISQGKKETLEDIETHMANSDIIQYIRDKYYDNLFNTFDDNCPYNLDDWNKAFFELSDYVVGNERRKYGICNKDDGLLLLSSLVLDLIS